jgi:hypothetical protein
MEAEAANRSYDVFDLLLAQVHERNSQAIAHLIAYPTRHADTAGLGQTLEPCSNIDAITVKVVLFGDDVAEIDADAPCNAPIFSDRVRTPHYALLNFDRAAHCFHGARKLDQDPVAHRLDQALVALAGIPREEQSWIYLIRLLAFILIIVAIVQKNMRKDSRR